MIKLRYQIGFTLSLVLMAWAPIYALATPEPKVTLCHAAGLAGTTQYVTITVGYPAAYGPAGHFYENGTPRAGHEQDYLGECHEPTTTTTQPEETTTTQAPPTTTTTTQPEQTTTTTVPEVTTTTLPTVTTTTEPYSGTTIPSTTIPTTPPFTPPPELPSTGSGWLWVAFVAGAFLAYTGWAMLRVADMADKMDGRDG